MKLNTVGNEEIITLKIDEKEHPIAYKAKLDELIECGMSEDEARKYISQGFVMEIHYAPNQGFFLVESEAIGCTTIFNPYDGIECECDDD
jgi:hypothetical protein